MVSAIRQPESAIGIHIAPPPRTTFPSASPSLLLQYCVFSSCLSLFMLLQQKYHKLCSLKRAIYFP